MTPEEEAYATLQKWQKQMQQPPSLLNRFTQRLQTQLNRLLPERLHKALTVAIKQMVRGMLFGSTHTTCQPLSDQPLSVRETVVRTRILYYRNTAAAEGAVTGAGGFFLGLADFPLLLGIKLKLCLCSCALRL